LRFEPAIAASELSQTQTLSARQLGSACFKQIKEIIEFNNLRKFAPLPPRFMFDYGDYRKIEES